MFIDSHCHLNMLDCQDQPGGLDDVVQAARDAGVMRFLCVGTDVAYSEKAIAIAHAYDDVYASVGLHPCDCMDVDSQWPRIEALAQDEKVIAIGETGLDYHYQNNGLATVQRSFRQHIHLAKSLHKPLIIHSRDAREDTIRILTEEDARDAGGIMHCFTENWAMAKQALDLGFYISISGIVTFKNAAQLVDVVKHLPMERCLIETDCPYLAPVPHRGKPNKPEYVPLVAEKIAEIKGLSLSEVAAHTTNNFNRLFSLDP